VRAIRSSAPAFHVFAISCAPPAQRSISPPARQLSDPNAAPPPDRGRAAITAPPRGRRSPASAASIAPIAG